MGSEQSNETYLGLTNGDFGGLPIPAVPSECIGHDGNLARGRGPRIPAEAPSSSLNVRAYHSTFYRGWDKVSGFAGDSASSRPFSQTPPVPGMLPCTISCGERRTHRPAEAIELGLNARSYAGQRGDLEGLWREIGGL